MAASATVSAAAKAGLRSCIFLHGLGDSSAGWSFLRGEVSSSKNLRWVFPNSPVQPVTLAGGEAMPSWMDLDALPVTARTPEDRQGFEASTQILHRLIDQEVTAGVPASSIYLGGFSQGSFFFFLAGRLVHFPNPSPPPCTPTPLAPVGGAMSLG